MNRLILLVLVSCCVWFAGGQSTSAQDPPPPTIDPQQLAEWVPAAADNPLRWRDDAGRMPVGPPRVGWLIGFNSFAEDGWVLPGVAPTQERLARCMSGALRAGPVITQRGAEAEAWRVRDTLRTLVECFPRPGGSLLIWLQARAWRNAAGELMLVHAGTRLNPAGGAERYTNALPLAGFADWLAEFSAKLGGNAPRIGLVLELYDDPRHVGLSRGELKADDENQSLAALVRVELAGPRGACSENVRADASIPAVAFATAVEQVRSPSEDLTLSAVLEAMGDTLSAASLQPRVIAGSASVPLRPARVAVQAHVVNALNGEELAGGTLQAEAADAIPAPATLDQLPIRGGVTIRAVAPGFMPVRVQLPLDGSRDCRRLDVALLPAFALLDVHVVQPDGTPAAGVRVTASGPQSILTALGLHRRMARTDANGRVRLPIDPAACRTALSLTIDDGRRECQRVQLPDVGDGRIGSAMLRGAIITVRSERLALPEAAAPLNESELEFATLGRFAWQQGLDAEATLPLANAPLAMAAWRSALERADNDATRAACRFRLLQCGIAWLGWCHRQAEATASPALLARAAAEAGALLELYPDARLSAEREFFEYAALPPVLQSALTDAIAMEQAGLFARALPLLDQLATDPRVPPSTASRCRKLRDEVRERLIRDYLSRSQRALTAGRNREALDLVDAATRLAPDFPLAVALQRQVLDVLAERNTTRAEAMPLRPTRPLAADATRLEVSHQAWLAPQRWFTLQLPRAARTRITILRRGANNTPDADLPPVVLRLRLPDSEVALTIPSNDQRTPRTVDLPAGTTVLSVSREDAPDATTRPVVGFYLRIEADWSATGDTGNPAQVEPLVRANEPLGGHTDASHAIPVLPGEYRHQSIPGGNTEHWFRISLARPMPFRVVVAYTRSSANLELEARSTNGDLLAEADSEEQGEVLSINLPAGDTLLVIRNETGPGTHADYSLNVRDVPPPTTAGQGFTPDTATFLPIGTPEPATVEFVRPRWLFCVLDAAATLTFNASFRHADGDVDLALIEAGTMREVARATGQTDSEHLEFQAVAGKYLLKVWCATPATTNRVVLLVSRSAPANGAGASVESAQPLPTGEPTQRPVTPGTPLWMRATLTEVTHLHIDASCDPMQGEAALALFAGNPDALVAEGEVHGAGGRAVSRVSRILQPGVYLLRISVLTIGGGAANAPLDVDLHATATSLADNTSPEKAVRIDAVLLQGLPISSSARWFVIESRPTEDKRMLIIANPFRRTESSVAPDIAVYRDPAADPIATTDGGDRAGVARILVADVSEGSRFYVRLAAESPTVVTLDVTMAGPDASLRAQAAIVEMPLTAAPEEERVSRDGTVYPQQSRWYAVRVAERTRATVRCAFQHERGDLDLRVWRNRERIEWSETSTDNESLRVDLDPGICFLEVRHAGNRGSHNDPPQEFRLTIGTGPAPGPAAGGNTAMDTALALTADSIVAGESGNGESRWYRCRIHAAEKSIRVEAAFDPGAGLTLSLRQGNRVVAVGETHDDRAVLDAAVRPGDYFIVVSPSSDAAAGFQLALMIELNDVHPIGPGNYPDLAVQQGTARRFQLAVLRPSELTVSCRFDNNRGDLDLQLLRADGAEVAASADVRDEESITRVLKPGIYQVLVTYSGEARGDTTCSLTVKLEPRNGGDAQAGPWSNVDAATARELALDESVQGQSGDGQEAWYRISLSKPARLTITVDFRHANGDIDIDLRSGNDTNAVVAESSGEADREIIGTTCDPGDWFVRVFNYDGGRANDFRIRVQAQELTEGFTPAMPLPIELAADHTAKLEAEFTGGLTRWYALDLPEDARVEATLETAAGAEARLLWSQEDRGYAETGNGSVKLVTDVLGRGRWLLQVARDDIDRVAFTVRLVVHYYSDATTRAAAIPIHPGAFPEQQLAAGTERWLQLDLPSSAHLLALVEAESAVSLQLHSANAMIAEAVRAGTTALLDCELPAGRWFLRIAAPAAAAGGGDSIEFGLLIDTAPIDGRVGRGRADAIRLKPGARLSGATDSTASVWFRVVLAHDTRIKWNVTFDNEAGDIDLRLWRAGSLVAQSDGTDDAEGFDMKPGPGVYFLELLNIDGGESSEWKMTLDAEGGPDKEEFR